LSRLRKNDLDGAIADYGNAIQIDPKYAPAYENRGLAESKKGNLEAAIADCAKALELNPTNAAAYNNRGWAEFQKNDFDSAIADATHAIHLNSTNGYAFGTRGLAQYGKGDIANALDDCKKAVELFGADSKEASYDQGLIDFINGDYEKAIASWEKVIQQDNTSKRELQPWIEKAQSKFQNKTP
jgi:tetratricopeptide (TPR) repeat protein